MGRGEGTFQNSTRKPNCTCRSCAVPAEASVNAPNGRTFNPSAATAAAL